ncbi:hypothetical protein LCGC14_0447640 [marine sediment metagenome]|uniref:DUF4440 domain-containing protein n=1 Tax=marine sediment metagenome TaxID=412755 RepID=A0A0F9T224_9ZZZZ|nr:DUF4440 domain-containing protein [Candidatus Aminicenantes bacterium]HEB35704.1 DUF4440 domain-containing protein [Candidatus Aminicenantes bacterium]
MNKLLMVIPLVILLCFAFGCQQGEEIAEEAGIAGLSDEDVAAIKTANDAYVQAALEGGMEATTEFYTEDTIMVVAGGPMIQGREALKEERKALSKASATVTAFNQTIVKIDGRDNLAFVLGTAYLTMTAEGLPEPMEPTQVTGKFLQILRKQEDGSWLIAIDTRIPDLY